MIKSKNMHIAPTGTPTPMPALPPVLSPELEGGDDGVGVEETLLDVKLDCVVEEDDVLSGADIDVEVEVEVEADVEVDVEVDTNSTSLFGAGA